MDLNKYEKEIALIEKELANLPVGRLVKKQGYYYEVTEQKSIGINLDKYRIRLHCRKKLLLEQLKIAQHNLKVLEAKKGFLMHKTPTEIIATLPKTYQDLPIKYFYHVTVEKFLSKISTNSDYKKEDLIYQTEGGILVRSKSEYMIATELERYKIPFLYEAKLSVGTQKWLPDFTIKSPFTGKNIIWEHFGSFHIKGYEEQMTKKMKSYFANGYRAFEEVIYTFEFDAATPGRIQSLIEQIILKR